MRVDPEHCTDPVLLAAEVRRLQAVIAASDTLTDAEREAVEWFASYGYSGDGVPGRHSAALRGLLERMSGNAALSGVGQSPSTPPADPTPAECSVPTDCTETGGL